VLLKGMGREVWVSVRDGLGAIVQLHFASPDSKR
jgi:hypothetical protein